jgi:hypothetical protein
MSKTEHNPSTRLGKIYSFQSLCRSGSTPIIEWLRKKIPSDLNSIFYPYEFFYPARIDLARKDIQECVDVITYNQQSNLICDYNFYLFVNKFYKTFSLPNLTNVVVIRDFANLICSRWAHPALKTKFDQGLHLDSTILQWKMHVTMSDHIKIFYNKWLTSLDCRKQISLKFNLNPEVDDISFIPHWRGGSTFHHRYPPESVQEYLTRYNHVDLPLSFKKRILGDDHLIELNKKCFNINLEKIFKY